MAGRFDGAGVDAVRRQNLSAILRRLHAGGPASRAELTRVTALNRSTVGSLVTELHDRGLVTESHDRYQGVVGRPSPIVAVRREGAVVLAIEIFPDSIAVARVGLGGAVLKCAKRARPRLSRTPDDVIADIVQLAAPMLAGRCIQAIGVGVAGVVRREDGQVAIAPNLGWRNVPLADRLRTALGVDIPVLVANDANLATLAEATRGSGTGCSDFLFLWGQVGVGAGIVLNGQPVLGRAGFAGEVGHMPIRANGRLCHCGARGCWETEVGEVAILRSLGVGAEEAGRDALGAVLKRAEQGDERTLHALKGIGRWIGYGVAGLVNVFDPELVALGGLFADVYPYVADALHSELGRGGMTSSGRSVHVVPARLGSDAVLLGAAELALTSVLNDPTVVSVPQINGAYALPAAGGLAETGATMRTRGA